MLHLFLCILLSYIIFKKFSYIIFKKGTKFKFLEVFVKDAGPDGRIACFFIIPGAILFISSLSIILTVCPSEYVEKTRKELIAFGDESSVSGDFFLGSGSLNGVFYYTYYCKLENGNSRFKKINAEKNGIEICEGNRSNGYISTEVKISEVLNNWLVFQIFRDKITRIHIPKGSIKREFKLDMM